MSFISSAVTIEKFSVVNGCVCVLIVLQLQFHWNTAIFAFGKLEIVFMILFTLLTRFCV